MRTKVSIGDTYTLAGRTLAVVEIKTQTDGNGVVTFEQASVTAVLKLLANRPLVVPPGDPHFACYLLRDAADTSRYAVGVYHPTLGERLQPHDPRIPPFTEQFTLCWAPGLVRVLINGQPAANQTVSIVLERQTADGTARCLLPDRYKLLTWSEQWQALVDSGERDTAYKTDADGLVYNAALNEPLMFPRGDGAWGQRQDDRLYDGAPAPEEYTAAVWLYFRGQRAEIREGQPTTLNWQTGTIVVSGPPGAWVRARLEDLFHSPQCVTTVVTAQIPTGGQLTLANLYPGRYCLSMWKPGTGLDNRDWSVICPRQWVEVGPGQTASIALSFQSPPSGYKLAYVYLAGADTQAGIQVWGLTFSGYRVVGVTEASGRVLIPAYPPPAGLLINDPYWGWQVLRGDGPTYEATLAGYMAFALSLGFGGEGGWFAFPGEGHEHLDGLEPAWRVKIVQTDELFDLDKIPIGARTQAPTPHLPPGVLTQWNFTPPSACYDIVLVDADGNYLRTLQQAIYVPRDGTDTGSLFMEILGGKPWGDALLHQPVHSTFPALPEAARIGLEHGDLGPAMLLRLLRDDAAPQEGRIGWVCPYCLCMTRIWPGPACGFCPQCGADARSYLHGPPASEGRWRVRYVALGPNRARLDVPTRRWYRPLRYAETDDFLRMYHGLPRWVCEHPVLGEYKAGSWTPGTDAEELEQAWCSQGERLLIRPKIWVLGQAAGAAKYRLRYRTDSGELHHLDFGMPAGATGLQLLSRLAPVTADYRDPADCLFVRRVTSVQLLEPDQDPGNYFLVVGDVPSLVLQSLPIRTAQATPLALQLGPFSLASGPDLRRTTDGRLFIAFVSDGDIYVAQRPSPQRPWSHPTRVTEGAHFTDPSIAPHPDETITLAFTDASDGTQYLAVSHDDGEGWETL